MNVAVIYTSTTPELTEMLEIQLKEQFTGQELVVRNYQDPSILQEARENGHVTSGCARRLLNLYERGVKDGAEILLNVCSSVGDIAKLAQPLYKSTGVEFVRIDEEMAMDAVRAGARIGVMATLSTTMEPTKRLVYDCASKLNKDIVVVDALVDGAFGLDQEKFKQRLIDTALSVKNQVDVLLFAQGSMAYAEEAVANIVEIPVFSSIRYGVSQVKAAADKLRNGVL